MRRKCNGSPPLFSPQFCRCSAKMFLDILAEKRRVWKSENFAYLFDCQVGVGEVIADFFQHLRRYPFQRRLA